MFVCVARLTLQIPDSGSLKAKRQILRRVTDRVKARFNVAVAEVDDNDLWQRATIGLCVVGNDRRHVDEQMEKIIHHVEEMYVAPLVSRETEILGFGDRLFAPQRPGEAVRGQLPEGAPAHDWAGDGGDGDDAPEREPSADDLIASFSANLGKGDRSLAEAEGLGSWDRRNAAARSGGRSNGNGDESPAVKRGGGDKLTLDEARARARSLRNPRDWEKK
ncbi:DUF503 domain-containing protein [Aggregicoccus sp. 17bor-14]|uniref:DUF503 domain-containing protein n=1 Tax=Myxococcaceae TaxID=31 RepID=UPI00129CB14C|nr:MULTISPECIES: DUF503 domain-containing protein [Myxococcaceae]MBF5044479.1 DUF503 domain-containing protein [Simulacricoccus sp. 17bor-14]MRI90224.1 DUF503 domain-containing protein [Aggregicoccus sp. 17bor-14]